nr:MAG TPA: hypothetical protein [Caudoviricetes sp.]
MTGWIGGIRTLSSPPCVPVHSRNMNCVFTVTSSQNWDQSY